MRFTREMVPPRYGYYAFGWLCFALGSLYLYIYGPGLPAILETVMILGLSTIVLYTGYELPDRPISRDGKWRALQVGSVIAGSFTVLAFAVWFTWSLGGIDTELSFILIFATSLGAAVGTRASLFAVQSNEQLAKTNDLTKLLRINQRVLRHNLRNELAIALGHLENIENTTVADDITQDASVIREHLEALLETTDRTRKIVAIWDSADTTTIELSSMLEAQIQQVRAEHPSGIILSLLPEECWVTANATLSLAIREALANAIEHNSDDVSVTVRVSQHDDETVQLTISDTGTGIPEIDRKAITRPEETPLVHARGLGLWILYWTVQVSDGTIAFENNEPQGTIVRIRLPSASPP